MKINYFTKSISKSKYSQFIYRHVSEHMENVKIKDIMERFDKNENELVIDIYPVSEIIEDWRSADTGKLAKMAHGSTSPLYIKLYVLDDPKQDRSNFMTISHELGHWYCIQRDPIKRYVMPITDLGGNKAGSTVFWFTGIVHTRTLTKKPDGKSYTYLVTLYKWLGRWGKEYYWAYDFRDLMW